MSTSLKPRANFIVYGLWESCDGNLLKNFPLLGMKFWFFEKVSATESLRLLMKELGLGVWLDSKQKQDLHSSRDCFYLFVLDPHFNAKFAESFPKAERVGVLIKRQELRT